MSANEEEVVSRDVSVTGDVAVSGAVNVGGRTTIQGETKVLNNLIVRGWLSAANVKDVFKGLFASDTALKAAIPEPEKGWMAGVKGTSGGQAVVWTWYSEYSSQEQKVVWVDAQSTMVVEGDIVDTDSIWNAINARITKVTGVTNRIAVFTQDGGLASSNKYTTSFANADHTHSQYLTQHQDISGKADKADTYTKADVDSNLTRSIGEAVRVDFACSAEGSYELINSELSENEKPFIAVYDGRQRLVCSQGKLITSGGGDFSVFYVFPDPSVIPASALQGVWKDKFDIVAIHIPSYVHSIGNNAFGPNGYQSDSLKLIECEGLTPPLVAQGDDPFGTNVTKSQIKVKTHQIDSTSINPNYKGDSFWGTANDTYWDSDYIDSNVPADSRMQAFEINVYV